MACERDPGGEPKDGTPGQQLLWYRDRDGDGYGDASEELLAEQPPAGYGRDGTDCDDDAPSVNPGAPEACNERDDDCDQLVDDADPSRTGGQPWPTDLDGDGYLSLEPVVDRLSCVGAPGEPGDCDDTDPDVNPAAPEWPDHRDQDCDGWADEQGIVTFVSDANFYYPTGGDVGLPSPALGDLDGDGPTDFSPSSGALYWGGARFSGTYNLDGADLLWSGALAPAGDHDRDGRSDVWVRGDGLELVTDLDPEGTPRAWTGPELRPAGMTSPADFDGDGQADLAVYVLREGGLTAGLLPGGLAGQLGPEHLLAEVSGVSDPPGVVPDLDGDGLGELLVPGAEGLGIWWGGTTPSGAVSSAPVLLTGWSQLEEASDVDGDGLAELLSCSDADEICYVVRASDLPDGQAALADVAWLTLTGVASLTALDLNGDGTRDLVAGCPQMLEEGGAVYLFDGETLTGGTLDTNAAIGGWSAPSVGHHLGSDVQDVGDLDEDGFHEVALRADNAVMLIYGGPPAP